MLMLIIIINELTCTPSGSETKIANRVKLLFSGSEDNYSKNEMPTLVTA